MFPLPGDGIDSQPESHVRFGCSFWGRHLREIEAYSDVHIDCISTCKLNSSPATLGAGLRHGVGHLDTRSERRLFIHAVHSLTALACYQPETHTSLRAQRPSPFATIGHLEIIFRWDRLAPVHCRQDLVSSGNAKLRARRTMTGQITPNDIKRGGGGPKGLIDIHPVCC